MRQDVARVHSAAGIDGLVPFFDVRDDSVLVDYERGAISKAGGFVKDAVVFDHGSFREIAEQWKRYAILFPELSIGRNAVNADAEDLGVSSFEFGDISLIRLHFLRSTTGER